MSTQPTYEKSFVRIPHNIYAETVGNIYMGHFKNIGTREGRLITKAPLAKPVLDRFKSFHQLEYSLPPSMKDRR
jgi:hypothetical protein